MVAIHQVDDQLVTSAPRNKKASVLMSFPHPISGTKTLRPRTLQGRRKHRGLQSSK